MAELNKPHFIQYAAVLAKNDYYGNEISFKNTDKRNNTVGKLVLTITFFPLQHFKSNGHTNGSTLAAI